MFYITKNIDEIKIRFFFMFYIANEFNFINVFLIFKDLSKFEFIFAKFGPFKTQNMGYYFVL